ncbi:MAG: substrate-binding domain-containing protein [Pseudomonadota bacterium]|nr:substrate-binding domain-containing protein [Pseudomonadota bacterium]
MLVFKCSLFIFLLVAVNALSHSDTYITLQSTTSTENSGLYDFLLPKFTEETGIDVRVVAVGTGQALRNARNGDGDILITHAREAEEDFVAAGHGIRRLDLMFNDFVIVGPPPIAIQSLTVDEPTIFLRKLADEKKKFVSRGDDSGTHKKELSLWRLAKVDVAAASGSWYRETGTGMGATLNIAVGMGAYTLTDRATWISFKNKSNFKILVEGSKILHNQYGIVVANSKNQFLTKKDSAIRLCNWLVSEKGKRYINAFRIGGQQLFYSNSNKPFCE